MGNLGSKFRGMGNSDSRFTGKGNSDTRVSGLENFRSGHRKLVVRWKVWERRKLWECTLHGFNCSIYLPIYLSMDGNSRFTERWCSSAFGNGG